MAESSPWRRALGEDFHRLHPRLTTYFSAIPAGSVGRGEGVFTRIGCRSRWLRPFLTLLASDGVLFPVWGEDVPFTVTNRPTAHGVRAVRVFDLPGGSRRMLDHITTRAGSLVDALGRDARGRARIVATLEASVVEGRLELVSSEVLVRVGRVPLRVPRALRPVVRLQEEWDDAFDAQRITLTLEAPIVGRVYEYSGRFRYHVEVAS